MLKNENGYPCVNTVVRTLPTDETGTPSGCGGAGNCLDNMPLAYVYSPDQRFRMLYSAEQALAHGTLFEELYKPMEVYGLE